MMKKGLNYISLFTAIIGITIFGAQAVAEEIGYEIISDQTEPLSEMEDDVIEAMIEETHSSLDLYMPILGQELNDSGNVEISDEAAEHINEVYLMGYTGTISFSKLSNDNNAVGLLKWTSNDTLDDEDFNQLVSLLDYYFDVPHEEKTVNLFWRKSDESTWFATTNHEEDKFVLEWYGTWDNNNTFSEEMEKPRETEELPSTSENDTTQISSYGTVSGNITYYYNDFKGNVADTGAMVILIPKSGAALLMPDEETVTWLLASSINECGNKYGVYAAEVDGTGAYNISHVPIGDYVVFIQSRNTTSESAFDDFDMYKARIANCFSSYLSQANCEAISETNVFYKYVSKSITIYSNETTTMSYDFGITYI